MVNKYITNRQRFRILSPLLLLLREFVSFKTKSGPEVVKFLSRSTQLSMKIFQLINVKMPPTVGILTFMSGKNSILGLSEPKKSRIS